MPPGRHGRPKGLLHGATFMPTSVFLRELLHVIGIVELPCFGIRAA